MLAWAFYHEGPAARWLTRDLEEIIRPHLADPRTPGPREETLSAKCDDTRVRKSARSTSRVRLTVWDRNSGRVASTTAQFSRIWVFDVAGRRILLRFG